MSFKLGHTDRVCVFSCQPECFISFNNGGIKIFQLITFHQFNGCIDLLIIGPVGIHDLSQTILISLTVSAADNEKS